MSKNYAIVLASGVGERTRFEKPKQFIKIAGKTVLEHTLEIFESNDSIDEIILVSHRDYVELCKELILKNNYKKISKVLCGGASRRESSFIGISAIEDEQSKVLIHDAVRPFLSNRIINECIKKLDEYDAIDVAIPSADTIIEINDDMVINKIPARKNLMRGQTPQGFKVKTIKKAHELANKSGDITVTDDCGLIVKFDVAPIYVVLGDESNIKITYPIDITIADKLFQIKNSETPKTDLKILKDKVLVVFGASKGIGASVVEVAKGNNAKVYGFSRANNVDVTDIKSVKKALEEVYKKEGRIDYIVNTVGVLKMGKINCREIEDVKDEIDTNFIGCINITQLAVDYLKETQGSLLFYTSSSYTRGRALYSIYSSMKAALVNLVQAVSEEWEQEKIRINIINPERTATPMRFTNFGKEAAETLLKPETVAITSLKTLLSNYTGQIVDVRKEEGAKYG